jgi:hypothetical protein
MFRRLVSTACVAGLLVLGVSNASATAVPFVPPELPRAGCTHGITDQAGDAAPAWPWVAPAADASPWTNEPGLDVLGVQARLTDTQLQLFLPLSATPATGDMPSYEGDWRYFVDFKIGTHTFAYVMQLANPSMPLQGLDAGTYPTYLEGGGHPLSGSSSGFIAAAAPQPAYAVFITPRSAIEAAVGGQLTAADQLTDFVGHTEAWLFNQKAKADSTDVPAEQQVKVLGDDYCFGPAPTSLTGLSVPTVQYGDEEVIDATLKDEHDKPLEDKDVQFSTENGPLGSEATDSDGIAEISFPTDLLAGSYPLAASYAGDATTRSSTATGTLVVVPETTVLGSLQVAKPSSTSRTATATLLDDDKTALSGEKVDWYVNGKKVGTTVTDSKGKCVYKALKPGQSVQAKFTAATGKYSASISKAVKV